MLLISTPSSFFISLYKTQTEQDWAYICKREYNYDVRLNSFYNGFFMSNLLLIFRIYAQKKMVFWPLATVPLFYFYWKPIFFQKHNKKLFDMCNVGE